MSASSGSAVQLRTNSVALQSLNRPSINPQLNVASLSHRNHKACRSFAVRRSNVTANRFFGQRVIRSVSERRCLWQSDGPCRSPKLTIVARSSFSQVPEKPLGLYDPSFDKDSCGVGFVAELSGESSRKTVGFLNKSIY